ncbi:N-acetylneuraminate synthase [Alphaproteobacteria bacterium]|nr:N-acetylneuraminate synthase [Alphaproteobacteria bacterium]
MHGQEVIIIAEAGVNHNGDMSIAFDLIDAAAEAGADFIKFQTFKADKIVTKTAKKATYQIRSEKTSQTHYEMLKQLELTDEMHRLLIERCHKKNIGFLSSGFDVDSIDYLLSLDIALIKIPSGEITNLPYLRRVGMALKPIILSTGMANNEEIHNAISVLKQAGAKQKEITILHCNSDYPTAMADVNLLAMQSIAQQFKTRVGYSDHTNGIEVPIAAVALGASVIEKHFTISRNFDGPDHKASLEPDELSEMVRYIRNIQCALGDGIKRPSLSESKNIPIVRKSIVTASPIKKGERFTEKNLCIKRPGTGISPMRWDEVLNGYANRDYRQDELISL